MRVFPLWLGQRPCESGARHQLFAHAQNRALRFIAHARNRALGQALLVGALALATVGCIPSHRLVHQGDRYFERCYGADFEARVAGPKKEACWQAWLTYYTKYQPAHRIDYALARIESLQAGEPSPQLPDLSKSSDDARTDAAPSQMASPTATLMQDAGPTLNGCLPFCNEYESACNARCERGSIACSSNCERERSLCLNGCY